MSNDIAVRNADASGLAPAVRMVIDPRRTFATIEQRDQAIVMLAAREIPPAIIEQQIRVSRETIYAVIAKARKNGAAIPYFKTSGAVHGRPQRRHISLTPATLAKLAAPAELRGITPAELAGRIVEEVVSSGMIDAVLDDGALP